MSELRTLDQLRAAFDAEFQPATPSEGMLVMQLSTTTLRLEHLTPRALGPEGDDKLQRELTKLEQHFQKTLRLLIRMQTARQKAHAAEAAAQAAEETRPIKLRIKRYKQWPASPPSQWENVPRAVDAAATPPQR